MNKFENLITEIYNKINLNENITTLEQLVPTLTWKQTTKQPKKYSFVHSTKDMGPMSYAVASNQEEVVTYTLDGKETQNVAQPNDIIISGPSRERYVIKAVKFPKLYTGKIGNDIIPEQSPRTVAHVENIDYPITFKAPWGEDMILKQGDYLVKDGEQGYYRIAQHEYEQTYNKI